MIASPNESPFCTSRGYFGVDLVIRHWLAACSFMRGLTQMAEGAFIGFILARPSRYFRWSQSTRTPPGSPSATRTGTVKMSLASCNRLLAVPFLWKASTTKHSKNSPVVLRTRSCHRQATSQIPSFGLSQSSTAWVFRRRSRLSRCSYRHLVLLERRGSCHRATTSERPSFLYRRLTALARRRR